ncbi:PucR family transcriptional regulator [Meiothermus granaticius]|uniref:Purine catabolism regulatory protein n=1 Tax=Meiothermus granaticius NBRC 107808 TaxID=1227551 RepID=A0A399FET8_9DEIN|nr:PucR family transcriptional regulator [Meiothermus granaticius]MCL6526113.1 helix-turn-helix domain-containing protein [Thermaceae bacterium]RIH93672.1 Purine catabolism regulatory protein [Meiothermus granaticius NBRC 107808]GEM86834.1 hypothetical protein MGR01S_14590 [Meiothermus granaticius NBRC 107808]
MAELGPKGSGEAPEIPSRILEWLDSNPADPRGLMEALHELTGLPVVLVAPWGEVLAWAGRVPARHPTQAGWGGGYWAQEVGEGRFIAYGEAPALQRALPWLELAARLLRLRARERALERAQEENLGAAFLDELLLGEADLDRGFAFGFERGFSLRLALIEAPAPPGRHRLAEARRREILQGLKTSVGAYLERLGTPHLLSGRGTRAVVLWQSHDPAKEAQSLLWAAPQGVRVGLSAAHPSLEAVGTAYREALIALKAARPGEVMGFEQLDPVAWVLLQQSPEDLRALVERFLPLPARALRTLEVYLEHGGEPNPTAQALHIHPNTLRYRLSAIEKTLGASLRSPETLARVYLALRARGLLEER